MATQGELTKPKMATQEDGTTGRPKMAVARIGPASWRNNTLNEINMSTNTIQKSDKTCMKGRSSDPLPHLREVLASLSNEEAHRYFRQTRSVVCLLRESLIDVNEEIKSLTRSKEALEKTLDHIRKDLRLNVDSVRVRSTRPLREKAPDGADDLLSAERMQLLNLKKMLENQLGLVQQQLLTLDGVRRRLANVCQERSRVIDLVCAFNSAPSQSAFTARPPASSRTRGPQRPQSASFDDSMTPQIDPLGPYTPEADAALQDARDARARSQMLRRQAANTIQNADNVQQAMHNSVNSGLMGKVAETEGLKQQLDIKSGETRHAINRCSRYFDNTEKAWSNSRGPMMYENLQVREKLDRPIIKVFQRHPGNNMPEAQEIVKGGNGLLASLHTAGQNLGMLRLAQFRLKEDSLDKKGAVDVDSSIVRMRRRKANHRWVPGQAY